MNDKVTEKIRESSLLLFVVLLLLFAPCILFALFYSVSVRRTVIWRRFTHLLHVFLLLLLSMSSSSLFFLLFFFINSMVKYTIPNNTITMLYTIYMNTPQLLMFTKKKRLNRHFQREAYTSTSVTPSNIPTYVFISSFVAIVGCLVLIYLLIVVVCMSA